MNLVDRKIVLNLNANWQAINIRNVQDAFIAMCGGNEGNPPVKALDLSYPLDENGNYDFNILPSMNPCTWLEWISLPIREYDLVVNTSHLKIRVPTVVVSINYHKVPKRKFRPTTKFLLELQNYKDGYTGKPLSLSRATREHINPRSKGGKDTFENLLAVDRDINHARGDKPLEEVGLKPLFSHKQPAPIPVNFTIKNHASLDWRWFIGD